MKASDGALPLAGGTFMSGTRSGAPLDGPRIGAFGAEGLLAFLALCVLMVATRPYLGIYQDANLYVVQALNAGGVDMSSDLFFAYGNQGSFLLFGRLFGPAVAAFGPGPAHALFWAAGLALWLVSLTFLARAIFDGTRLAYVAAALALLMHSGYGNLVLGYGESFVTPRLFAESFAMLAFGLVWTGRFWPAAGALLLSGAMHPLTAIPAIVLCGWFAAGTWRRAAVLGAGGLLAGVVLAWAGVAPFAWITDRMDPEWQALLKARDTIVFPLGWSPSLVFAAAALPVTSLVLVALRGGAGAARLARGLMWLGAGMVLLSVIGTELLANRLFTALQFWRFLLFMTLFGNLFAALVLKDLCGPDRHLKTLIAAAVGLSVIEAVFNLIGIGSALVALGALVQALVGARRGTVPGRPVRMLTMLPALAGILLSLATILYHLRGGTSEVSVPDAVLRLLVSAVAVAVILRAAPGAPALRAGILAVGLAAVAVVADVRPAMQRFVEAGGAIDPQAEAMMRGRSVYWEGNLPMLWFDLQMPSYYSCRQKGGISFFREQAFEFERRGQALRGLNTGDFEYSPVARCPEKADLSEEGPLTAAQIADACRAAGDLDILVLENDIPEKARLRFTIPAPVEGMEGDTTYSLYACEDFAG